MAKSHHNLLIFKQIHSLKNLLKMACNLLKDYFAPQHNDWWECVSELAGLVVHCSFAFAHETAALKCCKKHLIKI